MQFITMRNMGNIGEKEVVFLDSKEFTMYEELRRQFGGEY